MYLYFFGHFKNYSKCFSKLKIILVENKNLRDNLLSPENK